MKLGLFMMPLHPPGSNHTQTLHDDMEQIVRLDELGFYEAWIGEHFTLEWENIPSPELFIAMALGKTKNILLGTGVSCLPNHNPFAIAHRIAQLDHMARGRLQWGIGAGAAPGDFDAFNIDAAAGEHSKMTKETIDMVLKIWEGVPPGYYGNRWWRLKITEPMEDVASHVYIKPYQKPHPPIAIAGVTEKSPSLTLAGERGWIPMSICYPPVRLLKEQWQTVEAGARSAGRTPDRSTWRIAREFFIADNREEARREALEGILARDYRDYNLPLMKRFNYLKLFKEDPDMPDSAVTPEFLLDNLWLVGTPDDVEEQLRKLYADVGGFGVVLAMAHEWKPRDKWERSMTLLAKEVMPRLADLIPGQQPAPAKPAGAAASTLRG